MIAISSESKRLLKFLLMWAIVQDCITKLIAFWRKWEGEKVELIEWKCWKKTFFFLSFCQLKSTKKERQGARQGAMELIAERNWMLGFEMRYEKRAKDYGIEEERKTVNGQTQWFKKTQDERHKRKRNISLLYLSKIVMCEKNKETLDWQLHLLKA